ncbi:nucleoside phosphatase GDA1/CD39 [Myriangium duriaei CBS 260.36]|uniref:guanosine-diphosphatase n=1 Tax=Myriangium duriaei CBS 260.36 TaxID=1168546 RepID=A0A9P4IQK6_9PEZI|nr:nucleoside phosphatase GDA1/CD39 [Myriangium duriaei CBS 260.36]
MSDRNTFMGVPSRFLKTGGIVAFVLFVIFWLAPSHYGSRGGETYSSGTSAIKSDSSLTTPKCTKPYSSSKPLVQFALMVDAGSTGSRIHVYRFNNCGATPELEKEWFEMTPKKKGGSGLSAYPDDPEAAAKSLDVLLDVAVQNVPKSIQGCTPIAVKATAGLRKLGPEKSDAILKAVRTHLETAYPFPVVSDERGGVEVMDGKDEGVYAWITTNYLLGKIGGPDKTPTAAIFDLGGGSTQIVFEPTFPEAKAGGMPETLSEGDHKYDLNFGGRKFTLYQHSYLGYGLMAARENLHKVVVDAMHDKHGESFSWTKRPVVNPCIVPGMSAEVKVPLGASHALGKEITLNMTGPTSGSGAQCRALAEKTLLKEKECTLAPCAFNGVHQPSLSKVFAREDIYLFSYFYDRTRPLGMPDSFQLSELKELTRRVCDGPEAEEGKGWEVFNGLEGAVEELQGRPESCLDLNFMLALLHTGYEMPIDREVRIAKKIKGNELGWCLGASLPLLSQESGWKCKISQTA